jgi:peptidase M23-like protein/flagellar hook capping protein FlgD
VGRGISARPGQLFATVVATLLMGFVGAASATTMGGAPTPAGSPPPAGSPTGTPADPASAGTLSIVSAQTTPRKSFYFGIRYPKLTYTIGSTQPQNDIQIDVVDSTGAVVRSFYRNDVAPSTAGTIRWDGTTSEGRPARNGVYSFRIEAQAGAIAARASTSTEAPVLSFSLYGYAFPELGPHDYGTAADRFGAPRAGHTHQGQDVMAACGTPLVAARGGQVQYAGYEGSAGNYVVIDGKGTGFDFMYAHLAEPSPLHTGDSVRTGQPIGIVGETGDATACHLHFEMWTAPGWYQGGSPIDPLPYLEKWDAYS